MSLFIATILITSQELIGENIKCIVDKGIPVDVINRFCYFMSTFTVVKYLNNDMVNSHEVAHPGVGAMSINSGEPVKHHAYYQWVPFFLFLQGMMFYLPHAIWKAKEDGRLRKLAEGLEYAAYASTEKEIKVGTTKIPRKQSIANRLSNLQVAYNDHLLVNNTWTLWFITCELLNLVNLLFQMYVTNLFLNGQFLSMGVKIMNEGLNDQMDILDIVFPKMTKCTFHKFGPSGTLQSHDAMCVMALNIINEKIFMFLWFWYLILGVITILALIWRLLTWILHRNRGFNKFVFGCISNGHVNELDLETATRKRGYTDWLFLLYLSRNMDSLVFRDFLSGLVGESLTIDYNHHSYDDYTPVKTE